MTLVPGYYEKFKCIADKCEHNCCIGWEIDIDQASQDYYSQIGVDKIEYTDGVPHFKLCEGDRCPYLLENGLCDIISRYGEDALCDICTDHPRFRNFYENFTEMGLGLCCEEAARIILSEDAPFILVAEDDAEIHLLPEEERMLLERNEIFKIIQNRNDSIYKRLFQLSDKYGYKPKLGIMEDVCNLYLSLERLDEQWTKALDGLKGYNFTGEIFHEKSLQVAFEQLACYLIFRHFPGGLTDGMFKKRIHLVLSGCFLIGAMCEKYETISLSQMVEFCRMYSGEIEYSEENINALLKVL